MAESAELSDEHRSIIRRHKAELREYLEDLTGHGNSLAILIDGAIVQASIFATTEPILHAHTAARLTIKDNS